MAGLPAGSRHLSEIGGHNGFVPTVVVGTTVAILVPEREAAGVITALAEGVSVVEPPSLCKQLAATSIPPVATVAVWPSI